MDTPDEIDKMKNDREDLYDNAFSELILKPFSIEEYRRRATMSEDDIKHGRVSNADDV